jgi:hypothetical protein
MDMQNIGNGVSLNTPNNPGPAVFYARIGAPSPANPDAEQLITDRPPSDWMSTIQNATKSALSFVTGGPATISKTVQGVSAKAAVDAGFAANKIQGQVGKAYNGAVAAVDTAIISTAKTAQTVATGIKWTSAAVFIVIGIILLAQFRIAAKGV